MRFAALGGVRNLSTRMPHAAGLMLAAGMLTGAGSPLDAPPRITGVSVVPDDLRSGEHVTATVVTSGDATSVVAHVAKREIVIPRVKDGLFSGSAVVPHIPRFIHVRVSVTFVARGPAGTWDQQTTSVKIN